MKIDGTAETSLYVDGNISAGAETTGRIVTYDYVSGILGNYAEKELLFGSFNEFPAEGSEKYLYIDESENKIYRFDSENSAYKCVSGDTGEFSYVSKEELQDYYTKTETEEKIEEKIGSLGNVITIKGTADSFGSLPASGNQAGDLWLVPSDNAGEDQYCEYVWITGGGDSGSWEMVGKTAPQTDLSEYATKAEVDDKISRHTSSSDEKYIDVSDMLIINCRL